MYFSSQKQAFFSTPFMMDFFLISLVTLWLLRVVILSLSNTKGDKPAMLTILAITLISKYIIYPARKAAKDKNQYSK